MAFAWRHYMERPRNAKLWKNEGNAYNLSMPQKALLLMNMGGATTKAELHDFLMNMFCDPNILTIRSDFFRSILARFITQRRLDASWSHYEQIGGSPLPRITDELIKEIQIQL